MLRKTAYATVVGVLAALLSILYQRRVEVVQDWDCPPAPASCARPVLAAGFPWAYAVDYHGISTVSHVGLIAIALGEDDFRPGAFPADVAVFTATTIIVLLALARARGSTPPAL